jgi:hypothetical protein
MRVRVRCVSTQVVTVCSLAHASPSSPPPRTHVQPPTIEGVQVSESALALATRITTANKRTLDVFGGKAWGYFSLAEEKQGRLGEIRQWVQAL